MIRRAFLYLMICLIMIFPITGCWGKTEVEDLAFVLAVGIDAGNSPGIYNVTYQIGKPKKGGDSGGDLDNFTMTVEATSVQESMAEVYRIFSKTPFLGTTKLIVIGKKAAEDGVNRALDFFQRYYQFRRTVYLVLSSTTAKDILDIQVRFEKLPVMSALNIIDTSKDTSTFPIVRVGHYLTVLATETTAPLIPVIQGIKPGEQGVQYEPKQGDPNSPEELTIKGAGVFEGDRLKTILTDQETRGFMWLNNEVDQRIIDTGHSGEEGTIFSGRATKTKTKWKIIEQNGKKAIFFQIEAKVDLDEVCNGPDTIDPLQWKEFSQQAAPLMEKTIEAECQAAIAKSRETSLDFIGIGRKIDEKDPKYWREIKDQWEQELPNFPVNLDIEVNISNTGASFNPPTNPPGQRQD